MEPPSASPDRVADLEPLLRRVIGAKVSDAATVDDLVQETLVRILAVGSRLDDTSVEAYAIVTAQNLVRSHARAEERRQRLLPHLFDPRQPEDPAERSTEHEERRALTDALGQLSAVDRDSLIAHHVEGVDTATLGRPHGVSARAVSVRLARARARLRVEYVLARNRTPLPTPACKPVLLALSSGDQRRQKALQAGQHLQTCPACGALCGPLVQRRRPLALPWPASPGGSLFGKLRRGVRSHPVLSGAAATAVAAAATLLVGDNQPAPELTVQQNPPIALSGNQPLAPYEGKTVRAQQVKVYSAPGGKGFWIGESAADRIWVDLDTGEPLSRRVAGGQRASFIGKLAPNGQEMLTEPSIGGPPDIDQLKSQGFHVHIDEATLEIEGQPAPRPP